MLKKLRHPKKNRQRCETQYAPAVDIGNKTSGGKSGVPHLRQKRAAAAAMAAGAALMVSFPAQATEGGIGRPITGMQILPLGGILPTQKGLILSLSSIYYDGSIERSRQVPIGGKLVGGMDYHISYNLLSGLYVWGESGRWTAGSSISLPLQYTSLKATLNGPLHSINAKDSSTRMSDLLISPLLVDYHFSERTHVLFNLQIFAPTGNYDKNRMANAGQNTWTFIPNIAYTTILPEIDLELTGVAAVEFYTRNNDTDYRNGVLGRFDALALKRFGDGFGAGLSAGWIQQLSDDRGPLADMLDGNRGRSLGFGPLLSYEKKLGTTEISTSLRWIHEFSVRNRPKGDGAQLSITAQF